MVTDAKNNMELPGIPKRRGRPATGKARSSAERQAAFRAKRDAERRHIASSAADSFTQWDMRDLAKALTDTDNAEFAQLVWVEIGRRSGWLK